MAKHNRHSPLEFKNIQEYLHYLQDSLHFIKIEDFSSAQERLFSSKNDKLTFILKRLVNEGVKIETIQSHLLLGTRCMGRFGATCKYLIHLNNPFPHPGYSEDVSEKAFVQCLNVQCFNDDAFISMKKTLTFHQVILIFLFTLKFGMFDCFFNSQTTDSNLSHAVLSSCVRIPVF